MLTNMTYHAARSPGQALAHDVPGNSFIYAVDPNEAGLAMLTDNKYGYRGYDNKMTVTLLHSSYDPDRYPEFGIHNTLIALAMSAGREAIWS